jgi:hypothetical protein
MPSIAMDAKIFFMSHSPLLAGALCLVPRNRLFSSIISGLRETLRLA